MFVLQKRQKIRKEAQYARKIQTNPGKVFVLAMTLLFQVPLDRTCGNAISILQVDQF